MALLSVDSLTVLENAPSRWRLGGSPTPDRLVEEMSFSLSPGGSVAILGDPSDGTLALVFALLGMATIKAGSIAFEGQELTVLPERSWRRVRSKMPTVFSDSFGALSEGRPMGDQLTNVQKLLSSRSSPADRETSARQILVEMGLPADCWSRPPETVSALDRQRISLARALLLNPSLVLLHQVTEGLDDRATAHLLELLSRVRQERKLAYLVLTSDMAAASRLSSDWQVLSRGKVVDAGTREEVLSHPNHEFTRQLISLAHTEESPPETAHL